MTEQVRVSSSMTTAATLTFATPTTTATIQDPAWLTQLPVHQMTMTMYIPTSCVGALIGRKGSNIALIQKQAQTNGPHSLPVRVSVCSSSSSFSADKSLWNSGDIHNDMDGNATGNGTPMGTELSTPSSPLGPVPSTFTPLDGSDPQWTPVVIRADPLAVWNVATQMEQFVLQSLLSFSSNSSEPSQPPAQLLSQDCILDIPLSRQRHAYLVGKRGMTLQQVSAHSKCRIHVPPKELKLDMIQLEGSLKQIQTCLEEINYLFIVALKTNKHPNNNNLLLSSSSSTTTPSSPGHKSRTTSLSNNIGSNTTTATAAGQQQRCQTSLTVTQLPSQTKLRSVGRKTDTIIKKRKSNTHNNNNTSTATEDEKDSWILTIFGPTPAHVQSAHAILTKWAEGNTTYSTTTITEMDHDENNNGGDHDSASLSRSPARPPSLTHSSSSSSPPSMTTTAAATTPRTNKPGGRGRGSGRGRGRGGGRGGGRGSGGGTPTNGGTGRGREGRTLMASSPGTTP